MVWIFYVFCENLFTVSFYFSRLKSVSESRPKNDAVTRDWSDSEIWGSVDNVLRPTSYMLLIMVKSNAGDDL